MSTTELRILNFHGDEIATMNDDGKPCVAMRRIVENMGLAWQAQHPKLLAQKAKFSCHDIMTPDGRGHHQKMLCMPIEKLPLWLASINPNKISKEAIRAKVELYQAESAIALHDFWTKGAAIRGDYEGQVTGLDPAVMKQIGGMVKAILGKQLSEYMTVIDQRLAAASVAPTFDYSATVSSSEIIELAGIMPGMRVRGTSNVVTYAMLDFCNGIGCVRTAAELNRARPWRFPADKAREWLFGPHLGSEQIRNQITRMQRSKQKPGQSAFKLVPPVNGTPVPVEFGESRIGPEVDWAKKDTK